MIGPTSCLHEPRTPRRSMSPMTRITGRRGLLLSHPAILETLGVLLPGARTPQASTAAIREPMTCTRASEPGAVRAM